jgi:hypothetical protein
VRLKRILADLLSILIFVAIGRRTHDHGISIGGLVSTTWPFAVGLAVGWAALIRRHRSGGTFLDGVVVAVSTVAIGMVLRVVVGQGTAFAFIIVAIVFLSAIMLGWRLLVRRFFRPRN